MKSRAALLIPCMAGFLSSALFAGAAGAQTPAAQPNAEPPPAERRIIDVGRREFDANCASCHGRDAKGKGPMADLLRRSPPDLTQLARNNGGILPINQLYESIEGGKVAAHGSRDMPIWGRDYRVRDAEYYGEMPYDAEALVRARILSLVEYINRLQAR